jgi:hypothetical protein
LVGIGSRRAIKVDVKTIRRRCDPDYSAVEVSQEYMQREADDHHKRRLQGDLAFKLRALDVRRRGLSEAPHLIPRVHTQPCTHNAVRFDVYAEVYGGTALSDVV